MADQKNVGAKIIQFPGTKVENPTPKINGKLILKLAGVVLALGGIYATAPQEEIISRAPQAPVTAAKGDIAQALASDQIWEALAPADGRVSKELAKRLAANATKDVIQNITYTDGAELKSPYGLTAGEGYIVPTVSLVNDASVLNKFLGKNHYDIQVNPVETGSK